MAVKDAGLFGYYAESQVVNLDGKANGYEYLRALRGDNVDSYLRQIGVEYIADGATRYAGGEATVVLPRAGQPFLRLQMNQASEIYRSPPYQFSAFAARPDSAICFCIWRYVRQAHVRAI